MSPQQHFAQEHDISLNQVQQFARLGKIYARQSAHECNGDHHADATDKTDKNECARLWAEDSRRTARKMEKLAKQWGFHHLDFGVGFYPTLQTGESDSEGTVHFPYDA